MTNIVNPTNIRSVARLRLIFDTNVRQVYGTPESNCLRLSPDPLESAIDDIGRDARTTGEEPSGLRQAAAIAQRDSLVQWAEANGMELDPSLREDKAAIGGSEHDIWEHDGEMWKVQ